MAQPIYRRGQRNPEFERGDEVLCRIGDSVIRGKVNTLFFSRDEQTYRYCCLPVRDGDPGFMAAERDLSSAEGEDESAEG